MILLLDTSTPVCKLSLVDGDFHFDTQWQADRTLANGLLGYISKNIKQNNLSWTDIKGIGVFEGPGSFTGLRIGLTVLNTIADSQMIPIVGGRGNNWQRDVTNKLQDGQNSRIVLPFYGSEAHITQSRK